MKPFVLVRHDQCPSDVPRQGTFSRAEVVVELHETRAHAVAEADDRVYGWPVFICFWDLGVVLEVGVSREIGDW